jgi:protein SCO1/2
MVAASKAPRILCLVLLAAASAHGLAHQAKDDARLPVVGAAPVFALTDQDGARFTLDDLRGKVAVVTFIYATCTDTCPLLTAKMASLQKPLAPDFGARVRFVSITVDPEVDTPTVLHGYAKAHGANLSGWSFLTGSPAAIDEVIRAYGAYARRAGRGNVDHLFLTSLVDRQGRIRVQYLGYRFNPDEMLRDLRSLLRE